MPIEPPPTPWQLPDPRASSEGDLSEGDLVGLGGDVAPGTLLAGYRQGLFVMPVTVPGRRGRRGSQELGWWSPDPRGILPLDGLVVSRSLRRSLRRYEIRVDSAFAAVVAAVADPRRPGAWITPEIQAGYRDLHELGWAHSVEAWTPAGELVGGVCAVTIGGFTAGELMFSTATDASKVALVGLLELLGGDGAGRPEPGGSGLARGGVEGSEPEGCARDERVMDISWLTPHLASHGAIEVPRADYLGRLVRALALPQPSFGEPTIGSVPAR